MKLIVASLNQSADWTTLCDITTQYFSPVSGGNYKVPYVAATIRSIILCTVYYNI
jgi:hypothetical protein